MAVSNVKMAGMTGVEGASVVVPVESGGKCDFSAVRPELVEGHPLFFNDLALCGSTSSPRTDISHHSPVHLPCVAKTTPNPEEELTKIYKEFEDLLGGNFVPIAGSSGEALKFRNPIDCVGSMLFLSIAFTIQLILANSVWNLLRYAKGVDEDLDKINLDLTLMGVMEFTVLLFLMGLRFAERIPGFNKNMFPKFWFQPSFMKHHKLFWTPKGLYYLAKETWQACGRPGTSLAEKVKKWMDPVTVSPEAVPVPSKRILLDGKGMLVLEPLHHTWELPSAGEGISISLPTVPAEAIRNLSAEMALALLILGALIMAPVGI